MRGEVPLGVESGTLSMMDAQVGMRHPSEARILAYRRVGRCARVKGRDGWRGLLSIDLEGSHRPLEAVHRENREGGRVETMISRERD